MSDARTTLEVVLKATGFTEGSAAIKKLGDEATAAQGKLKTTTSTIDKVSQSSSSLGSKLKNAGSQFAGTITSVAALGSTVVNLSRQYSDLGDTQIKVDKTQLKVSKTAEVLRAAQGKLNTLVNSGVKSGAAYEQALLDVQQAQEASALATTMLGEAQEDQQRAFENFYMGLAPTILTAGSSITSMMKEMGGEKGLGGVATKIKGLGGMGGGIKNLATSFGPLAIAIGAAAVAAGILIDTLQKGGDVKRLIGISNTSGSSAHDVQNTIDALRKYRESIGARLASGIRGVTPFGNAIPDVTGEVMKSLESQKSRKEAAAAVDAWLKSVMDSPISQSVKDSIKSRATFLKTTLANDLNYKDDSFKATTQALQSQILGDMQNLFTTGMGSSIFEKIATDGKVKADKSGREILNSFATAMTGGTAGGFQAALEKSGLSFKTLGPVISEAVDSVVNTATTGLGKWDAVIQESIDQQNIFDETMKTSWAAFDEVVNTTTQGAATGIEAYNKTLEDMQKGTESGLNKIFAAYHKLHPGGTEDILGKKGKKIGTKTTPPGQLPIDIAEKALAKFQSGLAQKMSSAGSAKAFAENWIFTAGAKMAGIAGKLIEPIKTYIQAHSKESPEVFITGFLNYLGGVDLTENFAKMFAPVTTEASTSAKEAGISIAEGLQFPNEKMKESTQLAWQLGDVLKKIPSQKKSTLMATVLGKDRVDAMGKALANIKSKKVVLTVSAQIGNNVQQAVNIAARFGGMGAHPGRGSLKGLAAGGQGTVKRPTMFLAGEGGRQEDFYFKPRGSAGLGPSGGGGGSRSGPITIYIGDEPFKAYIRRAVNDDQGVFR